MGVLKKLLWTVAIAALLYGGYVAYEHWWAGGGGGAPLREQVSETATRVRGAAEEGLKQARETAKETARTYATRVVGEADQTLVGAAKEQLGRLLAPLGEKISSLADSLAGGADAAADGGVGAAVVPAATGGAFSVPPPPSTIVAEPNVPVTFSVNRGSNYTVGWGDGVSEKGTAPENSITLLTHTWTAAGDYPVNIDLQEDGSTHTYLFPVRVIAP